MTRAIEADEAMPAGDMDAAIGVLRLYLEDGELLTPDTLYAIAVRSGDRDVFFVLARAEWATFFAARGANAPAFPDLSQIE